MNRLSGLYAGSLDGLGLEENTFPLSEIEPRTRQPVPYSHSDIHENNFFAQKFSHLNTLIMLCSWKFPLVSETSNWLGKYCAQFWIWLIWNRSYKGENLQNNYMFKPTMFFKSIEIMEIHVFWQGILSGNDLLSYERVN